MNDFLIRRRRLSLSSPPLHFAPLFSLTKDFRKRTPRPFIPAKLPMKLQIQPRQAL
jgi:hypothetical protein